ncbi:MAG: glycoside hydrolase family 95 protein [Clostridia bacterium]|nr:glycoside hydrolase family 95 protein [Clostridia bacterium]
MNKLRYKSPAKNWHEALPLGNGITGAMVLGGRKAERIFFNDSSLWSGYPKNHDNPESLKHLEEVRKLVFEGKLHEADLLTEQKLDGAYSEGYLPLGTLNIDFKGTKICGYERELDIANALLTIKTASLKRESFISYPDKVFVYDARSCTPFSATITACSELKSEVVYNGGVSLTGRAPDYVAPKYLGKIPNPVVYKEDKGMAFALRVIPVTDGSIQSFGDGLRIVNATRITLYATTATGFISYDKMPSTSTEDALEKCNAILNATNFDYDKIKASHVEDYRALYTKQSLTIGNASTLTTNRLVLKAKLGKIDTALVNLFYNFGKYLTIAGSRKGGQALNLQGIWNDNIRPPWSSNYTVNINAQMNYWPTSGVNLTECLHPYVDMIVELANSGKSTAQANFGAHGFCVNHNTDIWRKSAPVQGNPQYMFAPLCGAWLVNELYNHYRYGKLEDRKEEILETVKQNALFVKDFLVKHNGYYVTCPSASPENSFSYEGKRVNISFASAFEMGIVRQSFIDYLEAFPEGDLSDEIRAIFPKLYPFQEGPDGLIEWDKYYPTPEPGHRHFSPLYAFHPARNIGYYANPIEREWVRKLMHKRIENVKQYFGWSGAWAISIAARLREADTVKLVVSRVLSHAIFKNLFDMHPPRLFQIDGNFGFVAGINEALCSVESSTIELLPALPKEWGDGEVKGMLLHGGQIDFKWQNGLITYVKARGENLKIRHLHLAENAEIIGAEIIK